MREGVVYTRLNAERRADMALTDADVQKQVSSNAEVHPGLVPNDTTHAVKVNTRSRFLTGLIKPEVTPWKWTLTV